MAILDRDLERLLRPRLRRQDEETWIRITDESGPLGTFSRKIALAHALGICNESQRRNLSTIRTIRNVFAHAKKPVAFNNKLIVDELRSTILPRKYRWIATMKEPEPKTAQEAFLTLAIRVSNELAQVGMKGFNAKMRRARLKTLKNERDQIWRYLSASATPPTLRPMFGLSSLASGNDHRIPMSRLRGLLDIASGPKPPMTLTASKLARIAHLVRNVRLIYIVWHGT